jgi:hypothetical protein
MAEREEEGRTANTIIQAAGEHPVRPKSQQALGHGNGVAYLHLQRLNRLA